MKYGAVRKLCPENFSRFFFKPKNAFQRFCHRNSPLSICFDSLTRESKHEHKIFKEAITVTKEQLDFKTFENVKHKTF